MMNRWEDDEMPEDNYAEDFVSGCEEAYLILEEKRLEDLEALEGERREKVKAGIQRMLWYFEFTEEYERCLLIKQVFETVYKHKISPAEPEEDLKKIITTNQIKKWQKSNSKTH